MSGAPLVLVTVGSDHHPFDRLVAWTDQWLAGRSAGSVRCVVQHGTSTASTYADTSAYLPHDELKSLMDEATVIVTQGGPMSIVEARQAGCVPLAVPRDSSLGEHVDDHQQAFCRRLAQEGLVFTPGTAGEFATLLDRALSHPRDFAAAQDVSAVRRVTQTVARFSTLVDELVPHARPRVLMIAGSGRSGSTLFERALAQADGVTALGETVHLWERAVRDDELCACSRSFRSCDFWSAVGQEAFGGWDHVDAGEMVALRHAVVRTRHLPRLLGSSPTVRWRLERDQFSRRVAAVLRAAAKVSGAELLIDSSKMPAYAALLGRADVDLRCVQVVRDPRGMAHSMQKTVERREARSIDLMHRTGAAESALWWSAFDVAYQVIRVRGIPVTTVRYEDFVADPAGTVAGVLDFAGRPATAADLDRLGETPLALGPSHQVAGNSVRFHSGAVDLRLDEEWRVRMSARDRRVVDLLTTGLRHRHGYR